ncbi:MAG: 7TM-DISM domain-containing protein, partial [Bdellovibrionales bacterium]|nr:7TM-DISM domain-containing protein [Bdellovibrionales bacterium]
MKSLFRLALVALFFYFPIAAFSLEPGLDLCAQSALTDSFESFEKNHASLSWSPVPPKTLSYGYSTKTLAIRIPRDCLKTLTSGYSHPIVSIRYPLSEVRIYISDRGSLTLSKTIGEIARSEPDYPKSRSHHFSALELPPDRDVFLVARSETSLQVPITFESMGELITHRETDSWLLAIHYGLLIMLGTFSLIVGILRKDKFYIGICSFSFGLTFVLGSMNWLPQTFIPIISYFFRIRFVPMGGALFLIALGKMLILTEEKINGATPFKKIYNVLSWIGAALFVAALTISYQRSVMLTHLALTFTTLVIALDAVHFVFRRKTKDYFCIPIVPIPSLLGLLTVSFKSVGLLPAVAWINYLPQTGALITVLIIGHLTIRV